MTDSAPPLTPPIIPSGDEIYRYIMGRIEPDLLPENVAMLPQKYADETPEQAAARKARYEQAFVEYDKQYAVIIAELESRVRAYKHSAMTSVEQQARAQESADLSDLEASIAAI